ncbi:MAG: AAA family ATPase [Planctomycetota bacterium]
MKYYPDTITGVVEKMYCSKPNFCAGVIRTAMEEKPVRFRSKIAVVEGAWITLDGDWAHTEPYGEQFVAEAVRFQLPDSDDGLELYLAQCPAFKGIGKVNAAKLMHFAAGATHVFSQTLKEDLKRMHNETRIPMAVLINLRNVWQANASENRVRMYLASFGLTNGQMEKLLGQFGEGIVGILQTDPYQLIDLVDGYGFKRADEIAQKVGVTKEHSGRIDAGILYALQTEINAGHTWTGGVDLIDLTNTLLALDGMGSRKLIQIRARVLIDQGKITADGQALSTPEIAAAEKTIHNTIKEHGWRYAQVAGLAGDAVDLDGAQQDAYKTALRFPISVISGGAGTGKTYTVARLTAALMKAGLNVALCAPTGKAAKRIEELLRKYGVAAPAQTLHRLLGYDGRQFHRTSLSEESGGEDNVLPGYQAVILDEGSMVDVPLMAELLTRIDFSKTRLVIVGDHNQLPPVGPGNVLRDILKHQLVPAVVLSKVHRQAGLLKVNSNLVLEGKLAPAAGAAHGWQVLDGCREPLQIQTQLRSLFKDDMFQRIGFDPLRDVQVITPTHKGPLGTREVNQMLQFLFRGEVQGRFTTGDKVIQTSNDYESA